MKKAHLLLIGATLLLAGCGDSLNGTYTGTETYSSLNSGMSAQGGAGTSGPVTITISGDDGGRTVNWVGQFGSGSGKGTSNNGTIAGLTMSMADQSGYSMMGAQSGVATNYNMTITVNDNKLQAQGTGIGSSGGTQQGQFGGYSQGIGNTRSATATQAGSN